MIEDFQDQQRKKTIRVRSIMDFTMGTIFFLIGIYFIIYRHFGLTLMNREPSTLDYFIGGLFVLYGSWRIYRGYKKDYYQ